MKFETVQEAVAARRGIHLLKYGTSSKNQRQIFVECSFVSEVKLQTIIAECNSMVKKDQDPEENKEDTPLEQPKRYTSLNRRELDEIFEAFDGGQSTDGQMSEAEVVVTEEVDL